VKKIVAGAALLLLSGVVTAWADGKNLQHFPKDTKDDDLRAQMKIIRRSLGTTCEHCHQKEPRDFSVDTDVKKVGRNMLDMVDKINKNDFKAELFGKRRIAAVDCWMCHKGHEKPEMSPENADDEQKFKDAVDSGRKKKAIDGMKKLVETLDKTYFTWKDAPKATCWMCHRGHLGFKTTMPVADGDDKAADPEKKPDGEKKPAPDPKPDPEKTKEPD